MARYAGYMPNPPKADVYIEGKYWGTNVDLETMSKTLRKQGYKVNVIPQAGTTNLKLIATKKKKNPSTALVKGFVPVRIVGDEIQARVTNPSQKKYFKSFVTKVKKAMKNPARKAKTGWGVYKDGKGLVSSHRLKSVASKRFRSLSKGYTSRNNPYWVDKI